MIFKSMFIAYVALISLVSMSESDPLTETGFTTDLIHRDSPQSPSYDPSLSPSQRIAKALKRSSDRTQRYKAATSSPNQPPQSDISNSGGEYLMKFSLGTPPVPSIGIISTGSDVIWTQCQPCIRCFSQSLPLFTPTNSSTYKTLRCNDSMCSSLLDGAYCDKTYCFYSMFYGFEAFTYGELASDTFAIASSAGGQMLSIPNITFGCGFNNSGIFSGTESGIVGVGRGNNSLVAQLGPLAQGKFSYCFMPLSDHSNLSKLNFGSNADVSGAGVVSTALIEKPPTIAYYITLKGISIGNQTLNFTADNGNMIIDTEEMVMRLPSDYYTKVESAMKSSIKLQQIDDPAGELDLCYMSKLGDEMLIPNVTVHLQGADLKMRQENFFLWTSDLSLCFAARPTDDDAIYGSLAQINFLVGYDLQKKMVSFKPTECGK